MSKITVWSNFRTVLHYFCNKFWWKCYLSSLLNRVPCVSYVPAWCTCPRAKSVPNSHFYVPINVPTWQSRANFSTWYANVSRRANILIWRAKRRAIFSTSLAKRCANFTTIFQKNCFFIYLINLYLIYFIYFKFISNIYILYIFF